MSESAGKRILMLLENNRFPQDPRVRREAAALIKAGYQLSIICPAGKGQPPREMLNGVRVYRYPEPRAGYGFVGYVWEYGYSLVAAFLLSLIVWVSAGFNIIHAHNPPDLFVLIAALYKPLGKRFIFDHHDLSPEMYCARDIGNEGRLVHRVLLYFEKLSFRLADHVIATNESYKRIAVKRGGVPINRVTVVRNGPDLDRVRSVDPDPELRQKADYILGYVGVMGFQDGVDYLIRALGHLVNDLGRTNFYSVIVGQGDAVADLKSLTTELGLDPYVWFTGRISDEDLLKYLSTADICVDPDPSNPFNDRSTMIKMVEYMALGKPIVAFNLREHRVTAQNAAVYAHPNDELDFARQIAVLMDDPERRAAMGQIGRERVESSLAWNHQVPNLLAAYASLTSAQLAESEVAL
jgi:glycosyltransferase involved in cell wall biosynthesis